jgi:hypothetical protein
MKISIFLQEMKILFSSLNLYLLVCKFDTACLLLSTNCALLAPREIDSKLHIPDPANKSKTVEFAIRSSIAEKIRFRYFSE